MDRFTQAAFFELSLPENVTLVPVATVPLGERLMLRLVGKETVCADATSPSETTAKSTKTTRHEPRVALIGPPGRECDDAA
ncbi:MAG: hypothetical protein ACRDGP_00570 [Actinomycetota bacterium]